MGGSGNDRHYYRGGRDTVADYRRLDVRELHRAGALRDGAIVSVHWGKADIQARVRGNLLTLSYRWRRNGGEWEEVEQNLLLTWTEPNYGGRRPWFFCTGCNRRVAILYVAGKHFACRRCYRLAYPSTRENAMDRALRRANKIRHRLGGKAGMLNPIPMKPPRMHWDTYSRLCTEVRNAELRVSLALLRWLNRKDTRLRDTFPDLPPSHAFGRGPLSTM